MICATILDLIRGYNAHAQGKAYAHEVIDSLRITYITTPWQFDLRLIENDAIIVIRGLEQYLQTGIRPTTSSMQAQEAIDYVIQRMGQ